MQKFIYVIISRTPTKFGGLVRKCAKQKYNHASVVLDDEFQYIYAFARKKHNAPLLGGLVRESLDRFTLRKDISVPVVVFKIPVTDDQHNHVSLIIEEMLNNKAYVYNLFSVCSYPIFKGFSVKNAFSCIEFVSYILKYLGFLNEKEACKYKPDDLLVDLEEYIFIKQDIRDCTNYNPEHNSYFDKWKLEIVFQSIVSVFRIFKHGFSTNPYIQNMITFNANRK